MVEYEELGILPSILAVRGKKVPVFDQELKQSKEIKFNKTQFDIDEIVDFAIDSGLLGLFNNIDDLYSYLLGTEVGLDTNARKNRGGHLMEDLVEKFIQKAGFKKNETYFKEMYLQDIENKWKLDMSFISNKNQATKRFDYVIKTDNCIYGIETNFYAAGGSKLNETARSYKMIAEEADKVVGFEFVWFTDGMGWISARNNLRETFDRMENVYNINDMKNGIMKEIFK